MKTKHPLLSLLLLVPALAPAATLTVQNLYDSGPGSLRQALLNSGAGGSEDTIVFAPGLAGNITLLTGELSNKPG